MRHLNGKKAIVLPISQRQGTIIIPGTRSYRAVVKFRKVTGFGYICFVFRSLSLLQKFGRQEDLSESRPSIYLTKHVSVPPLLNLGRIIHLRFAAVGRIYPSVVSTPYFTVHCRFNWKIVAMTLS